MRPLVFIRGAGLAGALGGEGLAMGLGALRTQLFARWMGPAEFGMASTALQVLTLLTTVLCLGLGIGVGRYLTQHGASRTQGEFLAVVSVLPLALGALVAAGVALSPALGDLLIGTPVPFPLRLAFALSLPLSLAFLLAFSTANALVSYRARVVLQVVSASGGLGLGALLLSVHRTAASVLAAHAAALAVALLAGWRILGPRLATGGSLGPEGRRALRGRLLGMGGGMLPYVLAIQLLLTGDRWLLIRLAGPAPAGLYAYGAFWALLAVTPWILLPDLVFPAVTAVWNTGRPRRAGRMTRSALRLGLLAAAVGTGVLLLGVLHFWPSLFWPFFAGEGYAEVARVLPPLFLAAFARAALALLIQPYLLEERYGIVGLAVTAGAALEILLALAWIPGDPLGGAAWASAAAWGGICAFLAVRLGPGFRPSWAAGCLRRDLLVLRSLGAPR